MKTIRYGELLKVVCPVCGKVILEDKEDGSGHGIRKCKHLMLWHNNFGDGICFAHRSFKSAMDKSVNHLRKLVKEHKMIAYKYVSDCSAGCCCQYPTDYIAFKK